MAGSDGDFLEPEQQERHMATQPVSPYSMFGSQATTGNTRAQQTHAASGSGSGSDGSSGSSDVLGGTAPNEQMFLQLLVAQIKNQDPLNPSDSTQFVSQLAQFSDLEQTIAIRQDADAINTTINPPKTTKSGS
jgi:flagellar basal-body rod modification protein FlgD